MKVHSHNLKVLQKFGQENFPLEKYIVNVDKDISPPSYLTKDTVYRISNGLPVSHPEARTIQLEVLNDQQWPPHDQFNLNESQYNGFRAALTKQLCVIQGPPGILNNRNKLE